MKLSKSSLKKLVESFLFEEDAEEIEEEPVEDAEEIEEEPVEDAEEPAEDAEEEAGEKENKPEQSEKTESEIKIASIENESNAKKAAVLYASLLKSNFETGFEESIQIPENVRAALSALSSIKIPEKEKYNFKTFQSDLGSLFNALKNKSM
jgi:hypothetical protein